MNAFSSSSLLTENALKPPQNWIVSIDGQHSKVLQNPKAMRYAFLPKRTGRHRTSPTMLHPRHEIAEARLPPPRHNVSMEANVDKTKPPFRCAQVHKKPPHARQRKPMRKAAK